MRIFKALLLPFLLILSLIGVDKPHGQPPAPLSVFSATPGR